ncbi:thiosulfate/3-mercaptopyruvate sulfurtransferase [Blastococcus aurantiacus]|uniref:Thiosulfate/3-mercaptopyruvate sulfurtransferase n=1 Tax=Blastococcus aurantiacus TaxID=1550231 RepID=A0A1G7HLW2_9ACTN|nr:thiosulfate/3-mercaptopyruvate sulfurtransferase [Blastococcus aurantiacus]
MLVSADELMAAGERPVLLDVRWALGDDRGREKYLAGHLPGAVFVDLESELADPPEPARGRHPLPSVQRLEAAARRWGIDADRPVVAYDDSGGLAAARAWWLLRWGGVHDVRLLDGGLSAWVRSGGGLGTGDVVPPPGDVVLTGGGMRVLDADTAAALPDRGGVLLDARAAERYRGEVEPVDPRAGHVPGATSAPTTGNLSGDGTFLPPAELAERFAALGVRPGADVGVYCGSGVTAAHEVTVLAAAGIEAALWPGSWSQWSADPDRPVSIGEERRS